MAEFTGHCARCHSTVTATLELESDGEASISPPPVLGSYCECGSYPQAVPLTLRGDPA